MSRQITITLTDERTTFTGQLEEIIQAVNRNEEQGRGWRITPERNEVIEMRKYIPYIAVAIITFIITFTLLAMTAHAETKEFSIVEYNTARDQYASGKYATAYNTLLTVNAPQVAIDGVFGGN